MIGLLNTSRSIWACKSLTSASSRPLASLAAAEASRSPQNFIIVITFVEDLSPIPVNEIWGIVDTKENVWIKEIVAIPVDI